MTLKEYRLQISFRPIPPEVDVQKTYSEVERGAENDVDLLITNLPDIDAGTVAKLREICKIPRMATIATAALINWAVARMAGGQAYVNVGVWHGFTFLSGIVCNPEKLAFGIDNFSQFGNPREAFLKKFGRYRSDNHQFYEMDYKDYFKTVHKCPIGLYVYDGNHSYEEQLKGLQIAEPFFLPGSLIFIDDANMGSVRQATLAFLAGSKYTYRPILDERTRYNYHPTFWNGIIVLERTSSSC